MLVCALTALLNLLAGSFDLGFEHGVALIFPASAVAALGGILLGWWGVLAVAAGYLLTPWGMAAGPGRIVFFTATGALQAAIPAAARLDESGRTSRRVLRLVLYAVVLNTLVSALVGVGGIARWADPPLGTRDLALSLVTWFLGDATAIVVVALPALLFIRPQLLMAEEEIRFFRAWLARWPAFLPFLGVVVADLAAMEYLVPRGGTSIHWLAAFLVIPVLMGAALGGVGGGLLTNGIVGVAYLAEVLHLERPAGFPGLLGTVISSYVTLAVFSIAAVVAGVFAGRNRVLLLELDEHRRLLQKNFESVVTALAGAIEAKDPTTQGHVQRVSRLATRVGRRLGITGSRLEILRYAAILHDVGKIGVPEPILNKRGPLTPGEREIMERHVNVGVEILESVDLLRPSIPFIRYHQERWDGLTEGVPFPGYFGLKGREIPLEARIIAVVDAYDAMINDRPYRAAMDREAAIAELQAQAGRQFDPEVVGALLEVLGTPAEESSSGRWPVFGRDPAAWLAG